jgi:hypothetical protein
MTMAIARTCAYGRFPRLGRAGVVIVWLIVTAIAVADDKEVKPIATAKDADRTASLGPIRLEKDGIVIRGAEELVARTDRAKDAKDPAVQREIAAQVAKLLKVEAIDWKEQMLVGIIAQEVEALTSDGKVLTVTYRPYREPLARSVPRTPKTLFLVPRVEGEVKFVAKKN